MFVMEFETCIQDTPCIAREVSYAKGEGLVVEILDMDGNPAPELEAAMTYEDWERVCADHGVADAAAQHDWYDWRELDPCEKA